MNLKPLLESLLKETNSAGVKAYTSHYLSLNLTDVEILSQIVRDSTKIYELNEYIGCFEEFKEHLKIIKHINKFNG